MSLLPAPSEWSPLEEQFHVWDILVLNPPPTPGAKVDSRVLSLWSNISITETHEGTRTQIDVNAEEPAIPHITELVTDFLFYRDQQLLYRLRVVDSEDVLTRDAASVRFDCVSYDKLLERRILHVDWLLDDYDINAAWRLIDYTQRRYPLGITRGTTDLGARRQRGLDAGDDILTAINDFAQADGGFDWWIDANLKFWAQKPQRGKKLDTQWAYGGEVAEMSRVNPIEDYSSVIMATGAQSEVRIPRADGNEDVYPPPLPQVVELTSKPLGLWEMTTSDTDVLTTASLREKALWHLADKGAIRPTYKVTLEPGVWQPSIALGDTLMLRIDTVRANVKVPIRIEELSITCTADGAEAVQMSVRAQEPETPVSALPGGLEPLPMLLAGTAPEPNGRTVQRHRLSEADDLGALLRFLRKRLERIERSPGVGGGGGTVILDGVGPPPESVGSEGDYYVDTLGQEMYGPKTGEYTEEVGGGGDYPNVNRPTGEYGTTMSMYEPGWLLGWRYRRMEDSSSPMRFRVWELITQVSPGVGNVLQDITVNDVGEGEFEVRLPTPIYSDGETFNQRLMISMAGDKVPCKTAPPVYNQTYGDWWNFTFIADFDPVIGEVPIRRYVSYPGYDTMFIYPIVLKQPRPWLLTNMARSGSPWYDGQRAELHRNMAPHATSSADYMGLRFYSGGESYEHTYWDPEDRPDYYSTSMWSDNYGGVELLPESHFDEYGSSGLQLGIYKEFWTSYTWYYDYSYNEMWCWTPPYEDDPTHEWTQTPGSGYGWSNMTDNWDWFNYSYSESYGPWFGEPVEGPDGTYVHDPSNDGGVGIHYQVGELRFGGSMDETSAIAHIHCVSSDSIHGTQITCTPKVLQANFQPIFFSQTWWGGRWAHTGLTPKGCIVPLVTSTSNTTTNADDPWQNQYFRQIGTNQVAFTDGIGTITVPDAMMLPAVIVATVDGITVGGPRVAQTQRTSEFVITVALDSAVTGTVGINWSVEHPMKWYPDPPPSVDTIRNPGTMFQYGNDCEWSEFGGSWCFEIVSWGHTFQNGCIIVNSNREQVGGPFTVVTEDLGGTSTYHQIPSWCVQRNWHPIGTNAEFQLINPDGQRSQWFVIHYVEPGDAHLRVAKMGQRAAEVRGTEDEWDPYSRKNNPRMNPNLRAESAGVNPLIAEPGRHLTAAEARAADPKAEPFVKQPLPTRGHATEHKRRREAQKQRLEEDAATTPPE